MLEGESHHLLWLWLRLTSLCVKEKKSNCADQKKFKQGKPNSQIRRLHMASANRTASIQEEFILFWGDEYFTAYRNPLWRTLQPRDPSHSHTHVCFTIPSMYPLHQTKDESHQQAERSHFLPNFQVWAICAVPTLRHLKVLRKHTRPLVTICMLTSFQGKMLFLSHAPPSHKAIFDWDC